jgi:hypothetical protein
MLKCKASDANRSVRQQTVQPATNEARSQPAPLHQYAQLKMGAETSHTLVCPHHASSNLPVNDSLMASKRHQIPHGYLTAVKPLYF